MCLKKELINVKLIIVLKAIYKPSSVVCGVKV